MRNIILPGDEACPDCSRDAILVPLCPCLAELWLVKVMSADGPTSGRDILHVAAQGSLFGARFRQPMLPWGHFELFPWQLDEFSVHPAQYCGSGSLVFHSGGGFSRVFPGLSS